MGIRALAVFLFRFKLPGSARWLATYGRGQRALEIPRTMNLPGPTETLTTDAPGTEIPHENPPGGVVIADIIVAACRDAGIRAFGMPDAYEPKEGAFSCRRRRRRNPRTCPARRTARFT